MKYQDIWQAVLDQLQDTIPKTTFNVFFKNSNIQDIEEKEGRYIITIPVPHSPAQNSFEKFSNEIESALVNILAMPCDLNFTIQKGGTNNTESLDSKISHQLQHANIKKNEPQNKKMRVGYDETLPPLFQKKTEDALAERASYALLKSKLIKANLNQEQTFDNFAVSPTNEVAFASATTVARIPGKAYNPLFIYGDVGVGKTHLMNAAGFKILENNPDINIVNTIGETFTNEIIEAIGSKKTPQFRNKYRNVDALLIDDIQFIAGKDYVQEEFFHTFNAIKSAGGQVIMTADKPPHEIKFLEDRLRSRFEEGLAIDIQAPNFELRTAILLIKSKNRGIKLSMQQAQEIAQRITSTRKLEGFLNTIMVDIPKEGITDEYLLQKLKGQKVDETLKLKDANIRPIEVLKKIAKRYNITLDQIIGKRRSKPIVTPRQYAIYILRVDMGISLQEVGRIVGGRDHSTIMHSVDKITLELSKSQQLQQEFSTIRKLILG